MNPAPDATTTEKLANLRDARQHLLDYCRLINPRYVAADHLIYLCAQLERAERREITRLVITMPPQHGKSWTATQHFPAWAWGRHPEWNVITAAYNEDKARDFGLAVKAQIDDPLYGLMFDRLKLRPESTSVLHSTNTAGGEYFAIGRGGGATGRRADLFIVDDPYKNREEASSEAVRREVRNWWKDIIQPRSKVVIVIHTRWDEDDMIGWLLSEYANENWTVINFPALAEGPGDILDRRIGDALWPSHKSRAELEKIRDQDPINFQALYQQHPVGAGARMFKREWLEASHMNCRYDPIQQPLHSHALRNMNKLMLIDPAHTKKLGSDYTTIWVLGLAADRRFHVLDMLRDRLNQVERADAVFRLHRQWMQPRIPASWVFQEQLHLDESYFKDRMARENYSFPIYPLGGHVPKWDRIGWLVGPISQAHYRFPLFCHRTTLAGVEEDLMRIFIDSEYANYLVGGGGVTHDDMLDSLARSQDPEVTKRIVWPRPNEEADPNDVLRRWRARHRAAGGTWAGL